MEGGDEGWEEYTSDLLVKFLMSRNVPFNVVNDLDFQTLLRSVAQHGQQTSMLLENHLVIQSSLWKFKHEIKQYMQMVIESWKTTGCTMMSYNLRGHRHKNKVVLGFYCPKGFIFVEAGPSRQEVGNALKNLVSDDLSCRPWKNVMQYVRHESCSYHSECQYQALDLNDAVEMSCGADETKCIRQQIQVLWENICGTSKWVQSLTKKSDQIYDYIVTANWNKAMYTTLKQKGVGQVAGWKPASSFKRLGMVMKVEVELKAWLLQLSESERFRLDIRGDIAALINSSEFWTDGNELLRVLAPLFKIPLLLDTLVPSAGYLGLAIDKAKGLLQAYSECKPMKFKQILKCLDDWRSYSTHTVQDLCDYLSPAYILRPEVLDNLNLAEYPSWLYSLAEEDEEDELKVLDPEIRAYNVKSSNPFANLSISECETTHPATLWSKYGGGFPLLQKCAYKLLSQPACCLCKQVAKHMPKLEGVDNYILRLNALMMEEFTKMGDGYQPIHI